MAVFRGPVFDTKGASMAKALSGFLPSDLRAPSTSVEVVRLRRRIAELEALVLTLKAENDALTTAQAALLLDAEISDLLPA